MIGSRWVCSREVSLGSTWKGFIICCRKIVILLECCRLRRIYSQERDPLQILGNRFLKGCRF